MKISVRVNGKVRKEKADLFNLENIVISKHRVNKTGQKQIGKTFIVQRVLIPTARVGGQSLSEVESDGVMVYGFLAQFVALV